jgi:hypothetical protein
MSLSQRALRIGDVMQLGRPTRIVLGVDILICCRCRRILWTARIVHEASEAISLVSNPSLSKVSIKTCCARCSGGAIIIVDDTKAPILAGKEGRSWMVPELLIALGGRAGTCVVQGF